MPNSTLPRSLLLAALLALSCAAASAQLTSGSKMPNFAEAFGIEGNKQTTDYSVDEIGVRAGNTTMANVLWPGDKAEFALRFVNKTHHGIKAKGKIIVERYGTAVPEGEIWEPHVFKIADESFVPIDLDLPSGGSQEIIIHPDIPEIFGGYALIADVEEHGRAFAATLVRTLPADPGRVQYPTYAIDLPGLEVTSEGVFVMLQRLGIKGVRLGTQYVPTTDPGYSKELERSARFMEWAQRHDVTAMMTLSAGNTTYTQPLGRPRPWLTEDGTMVKGKDDRAWLPSYDQDFQKWVETLAKDFGWPKGNLNAMELWNEPWDGHSIAGWGSDIPRYREIYTHMAEGIVAASESTGTQVLIGGTCSSMNAHDKLFPDGSDQFLKWMDFVSIHYQALAADPSLVPEWVNRKSPFGAVRVWDTESWIANSEDRVAGVIASMRAQGQSRTAGVYRGNAYDAKIVKAGDRVYPVVQVWSTSAAIAASQKFIGQRDFNRLLFKNGLPWVFVFDGLPVKDGGKAKPDDGTVVIVGNLAKIYTPDRTLFRSVSVAPKSSLSINDPSHTLHVYDFYGNLVPQQGDKVVVPLNGFGYFLRANGTPGSFEKLLKAVTEARTEGYAPVEIVAHDLTAPLDANPSLKVTLTNILNRPITGHLTASLAGAELSGPKDAIALQPNERRDILVPVLSGKASMGNIYPLKAAFDAGPDGSASHTEDMHVNVIAKRTITIDGDLADWKGILPQILPGSAIGASQSEEAYLPFVDFNRKATEGSATAYLAYDDNFFYFAARIADSTQDPGMVRFATRDDDSYFYPDRVSGLDGKLLIWPANTPHFTYRKNYEVPSGTALHDNVQLAFNVLEQKPWLPNPPGVMPHFISYWDTDYEYALNPVAAQNGGGTEMWRLLAPGVPRKSDFPHQPKAPIDQGPVKDGKLVITHNGDTRIVEAAIPWAEIPEVHKRILAGQTVKFTCRVSDNKGKPRELATGRSVSKDNPETFHDSWQTHWSNELEFGVQK